MFRLSLFGGFQLEDLAGNMIKLRTRKAQLLLAYLCLFPRMDHSRDRLIDLFWSEIPLDKADNNLRQAIHTLRPVLEAGDSPRGSALTVKQGLVRFEIPESAWIDAQHFEQKLKDALQLSGAAKAMALEEAISLYRGELLESAYDDWCLESQNHYRAQYLRALNELVTHFTENKAVEQAIRYAQLSVAKDPFQEEMHRQLMYLHHIQGDRAAALQQYHECKRTLIEELNVEPTTETEMLYREIESRSSVQKIESMAEQARRLIKQYPELQPPFVNREVELARFIKAIEQALAEKTEALLFSGEAGIGKTRLAQECLNYADSQGFFTMKGRCYEIEGSLPYQALIDALRAALPRIEKEQLQRIPALWLAEVVKLVPEIAEIAHQVKSSPPLFSPEQERNRIFEGVSQFLVGLSRERPLVLFLDDLQWADASTLQFLSYFVRHITPARVLLLGAFREEDVQVGHSLWSTLHQLLRDQLVEQVSLKPLIEEKLQELVGGMLKTQELPALTQRVYTDSRGLPFFAEELVKSYVQQGFLTFDKQKRWRYQDQSTVSIVPSSIRSLIASRLGRLSMAGRELIEHGAVMGSAFEISVLAQFMGTLDADVLRRADEVLRAGFIETEGRTFKFRHDLTRQAIRDGLSPERRRLMHAKAADTLEAQASGSVKTSAPDSRLVGELARHFSEAHQWPKALEYNLKAGWQFWKQSYAKEEALNYFRQALKAAERLEDQDGLMQAYKGLGEVCAFCDEQGGLEYCQSALELCEDDNCRAEIYCAMANVYQLQKDLEAGLPLLQTALKGLEDEEESLTLVRTLYHLANYSNWMGRPTDAVTYCERALRALENLGDERWQALILSEMGHAHIRQGEYASATNHLRKAIKMSEAAGDQHALKQATFHLGYACFHNKKPAQALTQWKQALRICESIQHSAADIAAISNWAAKASICVGKLNDALAFAQASLENDLQTKSNVNIASSHVSLGCLYDRIDNPVQAAAEFKRALELEPSSATVYQVAIEYYLLLDKLDKALEWFKRGRDFLTLRRLQGLKNWSKFTKVAKQFSMHPEFQEAWKDQQEAQETVE